MNTVAAYVTILRHEKVVGKNILRLKNIFSIISIILKKLQTRAICVTDVTKLIKTSLDYGVIRKNVKSCKI